MSISMSTFVKMTRTYGADFTRWPGIDPRDAAAFAQRHPKAQKALDEAIELDTLLAGYNAGAPAAGLTESIMKRTGERRQDDPVLAAQAMRHTVFSSWNVAMAACLVLLAGFAFAFLPALKRDAPQEAPARMAQAEQQAPAPAPTDTADADPADVEAFVADLSEPDAETAEAEALFALLDTADHDEVDRFLDEMTGTEDEESAPEDIWNEFMSEESGNSQKL